MHVYLWCLLVLPFYDIIERQLHNNNARGINIQLQAHQLHINNCWGINCVIIPAPMAIIQKRFASDATPKRHLMAHQMKILCCFSVFHCVEGAFGASSGGTPKMKNGAPRYELENGRGRGWAVAHCCPRSTAARRYLLKDYKHFQSLGGLPLPQKARGVS